MEDINEAWAREVKLQKTFDGFNPNSSEPYEVRHRGIPLESRWRSACEHEKMRYIVDALPFVAQKNVKAIWCDSQAGNTFVVILKRMNPITLKAFADLAPVHNIGHNGITFCDQHGDLFDECIDPDWNEDF